MSNKDETDNETSYETLDETDNESFYEKSDEYKEKEKAAIQKRKEYEAIQQEKEKKAIQKAKKEAIFSHFNSAAEYNCPWLNIASQTINLEDGDQTLVYEWADCRYKVKMTFGARFKKNILMFIFLAIYAIISFAMPPASGATRLDAAIQAFFIWLIPYLILCFRTLDSYIKAIVVTAGIHFPIYLLYNNTNLITFNGIPFLKYFAFLYNLPINIFRNLINSFANNVSATNDFEFAFAVMLMFFALELILVLIYWIIKKPPRIKLIVSRRAIFIRDKTKKSTVTMIKLFLWMVVNPFNVQQYKEIVERIKYNKITAHEGHENDFSKIPFDSVKKIKKSKNAVFFKMLLSLLGIGIGIFITIRLSLFGIILIFFSFIHLIKKIRTRKTYTIKIFVKRSKVEGSWIRTHDKNVIIFDRLPTVHADKFQEVKK